MIDPDANLVDYVDDYVHGLLDTDDAARIANYCETSAVGRAALVEANQRLAVLNSLPPSIATSDLIDRVMAQVDQVERRAEGRWRLYARGVYALAAAAALVLSCVSLYYLNLQPSPLGLRLLGQNQWMPDTQVTVRVAAWDMQRGTPQTGVQVSFNLIDRRRSQRVSLADAVTDKHGNVAPELQVPSWPDGEYELEIATDYRGQREVLARPIQLRRNWRVMLTTDKPVYQPGQTIRLRCLGLQRPQGLPVAGQNTEFEIYDPKGNLIFRRQDVTSRYGIAATDCPLAAEVIEGNYRIVCRVADTASETTVSVQKYVLPKFRINIQVDKSFYSPGDTVNGQIHAEYFFGKPVGQAQVEIVAKDAGFGQKPIASLQLKTDPEGRAAFSFRLPERLAGTETEGGMTKFQVAATVIDTAGQSQSRALSRTVAAEPIQVTIIPEGGQLTKGLANRVFVVTQYADGQPAICRLAISGLDREVSTNDAGIAVIEVENSTAAKEFRIRAQDAQGRSGRRATTLTAVDQAADFVLRTDQAVYNGGQSIELEVLAQGPEPVFVDLIKDGQMVGSQTIDVIDGFGQLTIDLPPEVAGVVQIVAFRAGNSSSPVRRSRAIVVQPARQLQIQATWDQAEYRPGQRARLQFQLRDEQGQPSPGALSLHAVDEAVYSVLTQGATLEQAFYLLEHEALQPLYQFQPQWSPRALPQLSDEAQASWHLALFSLTATFATDVNALPPDYWQQSTDQTAAFDADSVAPAGRPATTASQDSLPYSLSGESYSDKARPVWRVRHQMLAWLVIAWCGLFAVTALLLWPRLLSMVLYSVALTLLTMMTMAILLLLVLLIAGCGAPDGPVPPPAKDYQYGPPITQPTQPSPPAAQPNATNTQAAVRTREWFPETLLWRPELITDDQGVATLEIDLADSITTWRVNAAAINSAGRMGGAEFPLTVFQPFFIDLNLPVAVTRGDKFALPVVLYNYQDKVQMIKMQLKAADWYQVLDNWQDSPPDIQRRELPDNQGWEWELELQPGEVRSWTIPLHMLQSGTHTWEILAQGDAESDAIRRTITVLPEGEPREEVINGPLGSAPVERTWQVPTTATSASGSVVLKLYPSSFSQCLEGLEGIFRLPSGCFEQTSSTTYPNVLALQFLRRVGKIEPAVELRARHYIHLGYQRLLGFETPSGGFEWFGRGQGDLCLTAYGLLQFRDMAEVHDVDPKLLERTTRWLLARQNSDGSWHPSSRAGRPTPTAILETTAYVGWAVANSPALDPNARQRLVDFLTDQSPQRINSPYTLALVLQALRSLDPQHSQLSAYRMRLASLQQRSQNGEVGWWSAPPTARTLFLGNGQVAVVETTALAILALQDAPSQQTTVSRALKWLIDRRDGHGTWGSTQATVLALQALLATADLKPTSNGQPSDLALQVHWNDQLIRDWTIPADQADVVQLLPLGQGLEPGSSHRLKLSYRGDRPLQYQLVLRHSAMTATKHNDQDPDATPLSLRVNYDRQSLPVNATLQVNVQVTNHLTQTTPMVMVELPIPTGFTVERKAWDDYVSARTIAKYELVGTRILVYLREISPQETMTLDYQLRAIQPVDVAVEGGAVYEYYQPETLYRSHPLRLVVEPAGKVAFP